MESKFPQVISTNESSKNTTNMKTKYNYWPNINQTFLTNEDYIKLFYNSKNFGLNKNFALNVIYNKRKTKATK